jgi:subtilisin family serine protease
VEHNEPTLGDIKALLDGFQHAAGERIAVWRKTPVDGSGENKLPNEIYLINLNRLAAQNLFESRRTVKADAAHRVFDINTENIVFAVIDSGIDATHPAFLKWSSPKAKDYLVRLYTRGNFTLPSKDLSERSRVAQTFDFTKLRDLLASGGDTQFATAEIATEIKRLRRDEKSKIALEQIKTRSNNARDLDWEMVRPLIARPHDKSYSPPGIDHGTHVAGILAADLRDYRDVDREELVGMCPSLTLYDLRVFDDKGHGDEFAMTWTVSPAGRRRSARCAIILLAPAPSWLLPPATPDSTAPPKRVSETAIVRSALPTLETPIA